MKVNKQLAEHYTWGQNCDGWFLVNRPEMTIIQEKMPPFTEEIKHYHTASRQFFYVLSGILTMNINDNPVVLHKHEGIEIKPGVIHQAKNNHNEDVEFILMSNPSTKGDRYEIE